MYSLTQAKTQVGMFLLNLNRSLPGPDARHRPALLADDPAVRRAPRGDADGRLDLGQDLLLHPVLALQERLHRRDRRLQDRQPVLLRRE